MFDKSIIQKMKQTNISVDIEKTKERTERVWKNTSKADRVVVLDLANVKNSTVQRAYRTGSISAKLVVALSQTLNINPYYLTGEADEPGEYQDELLFELLHRYNYDKLLDEQTKLNRKLQRAEKRKQATEVLQPEAIETEEEVMIRFDEHIRTSLHEEVEDIGEQDIASILHINQDVLDKFTEDDFILLFKSTLLRARAGGKNAEIANRIKQLLLL